jgi:hypothetical protein
MVLKDGGLVQYTWATKRAVEAADKRTSERRPLALPARLAWKDQRGVNRFATVVTRDISDSSVFVEALSPLSIPMYRLVQFQFESTARATREIPEALRRGRVLSAVYRISHATPKSRHGVALRLLLEPSTMATAEAARATA